MASKATAAILLLLAVAAAISTTAVDAAKRGARRPITSPSSCGGGGKSRSLKSSSTSPAERAASLHSMPSRPMGAAVKRSSSKLSKFYTSSTPAATISAATDAAPKKRAASLRSRSRKRAVGAGVVKWRSPLPALAPAETCVSSLLDLSPCLAFFKDAGATAAPAGCCAGLRSIVDTQAVCLCHIVNHTLERAIGVDIPVDRALTLLGDICRLAPPAEILTCTDKGAVPPLYACPAPSA